MKKNNILLIFILASFNGYSMTQFEFIELYKSSHPSFKSQELESEIKQLDFEYAKGIEDWNLSISTSYQDIDKTGFTGVTTGVSEINTLGLSASRKFVDSGVNITLANTITDSTITSSDRGNVKTSLDISLPLMKNKFGLNDRLNIDLAKIEIEKHLLDKFEKNEKSIAVALKKFIDLAFAEEQLKINQERFNLAKSEHEISTKKFKASVIDKADMLLQDDSLQNSKKQLIESQQELAIIQGEIALLINTNESLVNSTNFDLYRISNINLDNIKDYLVENSRQLNSINLEKKLNERKISSYENESLPNLDLDIGITSEGQKDNISNANSNQNSSWDIGLTYSLPIGQTQETSKLSKTKKINQQLELKYDELLIDLMTLGRKYRQQIDSLGEIINLGKKQIQIANERAREQRENYNNGNGEMEFVISAQNSEQNARLNLAKSVTQYQKVLIDIKALLDQLI